MKNNQKQINPDLIREIKYNDQWGISFPNDIYVQQQLPNSVFPDKKFYYSDFSHPDYAVQAAIGRGTALSGKNLISLRTKKPKRGRANRNSGGYLIKRPLKVPSWLSELLNKETLDLLNKDSHGISVINDESVRVDIRSKANGNRTKTFSTQNLPDMQTAVSNAIAYAKQARIDLGKV